MPKTLKWQKTVAFSDVWPKAMPQVPALDDFARECRIALCLRRDEADKSVASIAGAVGGEEERRRAMDGRSDFSVLRYRPLLSYT